MSFAEPISVLALDLALLLIACAAREAEQAPSTNDALSSWPRIAFSSSRVSTSGRRVSIRSLAPARGERA